MKTYTEAELWVKYREYEYRYAYRQIDNENDAETKYCKLDYDEWMDSSYVWNSNLRAYISVLDEMEINNDQ